MRKRNQRLQDFQTMGKKILCGRFADGLRNNFAVGDEDNNLLLYNLISPKPVTVLSVQANNLSALTALTFTRDDEQVIAGSTRGAISVWDLATLKTAFCLKGHTVEVTALLAAKQDQILASGSADTSVKVWDLRSRNCQLSLRTHSKRVNSLALGPQARLLAYGGDDGVVQTYDLRQGKPLGQCEIDAAVLSLDLTGKGLLAVGGADRLARVFDIGSGVSLLGCTKSETMPIASVVFYGDDHLFTAGTDNLKAWDLREGLTLTDNIETSSRGILHMVVGDTIQQIAFSSGTLSYHQCLLSEVSLKGPYLYSNISIAPEKPDKTEQAMEKNNRVKQRGGSSNPLAHITSEKTKSLLAKRNDSLAKQLSGVAENISDALSNIKKASQEFGNRKMESQELKEMMGEEHTRFLKVMTQRARAIQGMLDLWMKGNTKLLIQQLKTIDLYVAADVLAQILRPSKVSISAEFALAIVERAKEMILGKHLTIIKCGLEYMLQVVSIFKDEMIRLKTFGTDKGVDLAREERLKRYDLLIEQYVEVFQSHRLKRLSEKQDESSRLAEQLGVELTIIFKKVFGNDYAL